MFTDNNVSSATIRSVPGRLWNNEKLCHLNSTLQVLVYKYVDDNDIFPY